MSSLISELKRRNVFRVSIAYLIVGWLVLQLTDIVAPALRLPEWTMSLVTYLGIIGFPFAILFTWAFELTPEGLKRTADVHPDDSVAHETASSINRLIIGLMALAIAGLLADRFLVESSETEPAVQAAASSIDPTDTAVATTPGSTLKSIAVLPFVNMSQDPENEYFADGLSEELLNQLAQIPDLMVAGRTSSFMFKGKNQDFQVVGNKLGVANVLEGSIRRQGNKVRVTAQLIRVSDGFHLWSNTYDRLMDDVFAIQDDIASSVAGALRIVLNETARQRMQTAGVRNVEAFIAFQKGEELFRKAHGSTDLMKILREGLVHYQRAIEVVPDFPAAYYSMSDYYSHVVLDFESTQIERIEASKEYRRLLDAAFRLYEDPAKRAYVDFDRVLFSNDWSTLKDRLETAFAAPGCPGINWIEVAGAVGYADELVELGIRYARCEPLDRSNTRSLARAYLNQGQGEVALNTIEAGEAVLGADPWTTTIKQQALIFLGRGDEALALAPSSVEEAKDWGLRALPLAFLGDVEAAKASLREYEAIHGDSSWRKNIWFQAILGNRERANELAATMDALPAGPFVLLELAESCLCGVPWDMEVTPVFRARIEESGLPWPPETVIQFPAKNW